MSDKRALWAVLAGVLLCFKVCALGLKSSRNSSAYSYPSSSSYDPYGLKSAKAEREALKRELLNPMAEVNAELEATVQRHCSAVRSDVRLEIDFTDSGMSSLAREVRRAEMPQGAWLPTPLVAQGLGITMREGWGDEAKLCLDADETLLKEVLLTAKPSSEPVKLGAGAWAVTTTDFSATTSMVSTASLDAMKVKGQLVAFAPTDNLVVFADATNAAAITLAAKYAAEHTRTKGEDGCVAIEPLVRTNGTWGSWRPNGKPSTAREVESVRVAARECQANIVGSFLEELVTLREAGLSGVPFVSTFDVSEREFTAKRSVVTMALDDSTVPQLLSPATEVKLETEEGRVFSMSWETFVALGGTRVVPVAVRDTNVPNTFFYQGGLSAADFTGKHGVKSTTKF